MQNRDEDNLREQEALANAVSQNLPGVVCRYRLNADGTDQLEYLNGDTEGLWGLDVSTCLKNNELIWGAFHPDDLKEVQNDIQRSAQQLEPWNSEWRFLHKDGTQRWHRGSGMPTKFDDGSIVWDSLILDITREKDALFDRDRSRMAIKESEEKYRNLFELSPLPKWLYNHETYQIIDVNEASLRLYG